MDILQEYFDTALDSKDGIKKLREMILTLAMKGKLVPQDPADQHASELIKEIQAEKAKLIKDGKIKKQKDLPPIKPEEIPYQLPNGWEWVRLGDIGEINPRNKDFSDDIETGFVPMPLIEAEYGIPHTFEIKKWNDIKKGYTHFANGDVGLAKITPCFENGKSCVFENLPNEIGAGTTELHIFRNTFNVVYPYYLLSYFKSPNYIHNGEQKMTGSAGQKRVPTSYFESEPFPLPPLAEQKRIVEKIDSLMAKCDVLEKLKKDREQKRLDVHKSAVQALLNSGEINDSWQFLKYNFSELYTVQENVAELRKAILQLAMMGKLVPQDPTDQPASELLKEMIAYRNKIYASKNDDSEIVTMQRKLKQLPPPVLPFDLPNSWAVINLIECCEYLVDCHNKTAPYVAMGIPIIRTSNIRNREFRYNDIKYVNEDTYLFWSRRCLPKPRDIIFTREAPMGEAAIIPDDAKYCLGQRTMLIRGMFDFIDNRFLLYVITETKILNLALENAIGSTVKHLRVGDVENLSIPLPPLAEQKRIVAKIDSLMAICDELEKQITESENKKSAILNSIMAQLGH